MSSLKSAAGVWSEDDESPVASRVPNQSAAFMPALNPNAASEGYEVSGFSRNSRPGRFGVSAIQTAHRRVFKRLRALVVAKKV